MAVWCTLTLVDTFARTRVATCVKLREQGGVSELRGAGTKDGEVEKQSRSKAGVDEVGSYIQYAARHPCKNRAQLWVERGVPTRACGQLALRSSAL